MFDFVRSHNRILQVALGILIIPAFGIFGVQSYTSMNGEDAVAVADVDGHKITRAEWDVQHRKDIERIRARNPQVDLKTLDTPEALRASLDSLVRDRVMQAAVQHQNLTVSEDRIKREWATNPQFQQLRALPPEQQAAVLAQQGLTINSLADTIGVELARSLALQGIATSGFVPASSNKAVVDAWFDQRDIQWQHFDTKEYGAAITPTDAQVDAYYKAHAAQFVAPEQAKIEYVVLDADALKSQAKADPTLVQGYYDANKARYTTAEERRVSHILINVAPNASAADVDKAKAQAESVLAEVRKNPADFAEIAKKSSQDAGSAAQGGDLDFMRKNAIPGAFSDTLFAMKDGEVSNVVRSEAGFHIIKLTGVRGGSVKPFDEVKPQIEDLLRQQEAQKLFAASAEKFTNTVYEQPDSLDSAVKAFQLTKQTAVVQRKAAPGATGPLAAALLLGAVFGNEAIKNKHNTEAIEAGPSQLVSAHVVEYTPEHTRPLAEVRDQVVDSVRKAEATLAAKKDGEARVAAAKKDAALALPLVATVSRLDNTGTVPREVSDAALKADLGKGPTVIGLALPDGGYAAIRVLKSTPHVPTDAEADQAKTLITQTFEDAEAQAVYDSLKARYKVEYHEDRIAKGTSSGKAASN
ncbi:MAG: SurA N-terminal domain-containing protein [Betaproteobacteria bacterium]